MREPLAAILATLLLTSCQSNPSGAGIPSSTGYSSHGYDITGAGAREAAQVQQMLGAIAAKTKLPKRSPGPNDYYSPIPIALYNDFHVQLLASRHKDYIHVEVTRWTYSGASAFARIDWLVRSTLSRKFGHRFYAEPEPDYSNSTIVTE
jgi:hypothetical protein